MRRSRGAASLVVLVLLGAGLSACSDDEPAAPVYVALGDSYTAGPLIPTTDESSSCLRSDHNYPALVADEAGFALTDVSCTGAGTADLTQAQELEKGETDPQLDALDAAGAPPDLVTVGIGANDDDIAGIVLLQCAAAGYEKPRGAPCSKADAGSPDPMAAKIDRMQASVEQALVEVRGRAPDAQVLLVGYPQVLPDAGTCLARLPIAVRDYAWARDLNEQLDDALRAAADQAGVGFVDIWTASAGHDICSADPWINGQKDDPDAALRYHPFAAYEDAVARLVLDQLD